MGRRKIQIKTITDDKSKQVTFLKRKFGLMKKAYELSVLCNCQVALILFKEDGSLVEYSSSDMDTMLLRYTESPSMHEKRSNEDFLDGEDDEDFEFFDDSLSPLSAGPIASSPISASPSGQPKYKKKKTSFSKPALSPTRASGFEHELDMVLNPSGFDTRALLNPPSISPGQRRSIIHPSFLNTLNTTDRDWERRATMPHSTMQIEPPQETSNWRQYDGTANEITSQDSLYYASGRLWENTQRDYQMQ